MAIPASHIVNVLPRVVVGGSNDLELNGLLLTKNALISATTMVLPFPSAAAVGAYFGIDSVEYHAADVYFAGYDNKFSAPHSFLVARRIDAPVAAWLRSARNTKTMAQFKAITDGGMVITVDNTAHTLSALDFSAAISYSDVALVIQTALVAGGATGATVTYSSLNGSFTITSGATGEISEVGFGSSPATGTDLAVFMGWREVDGAIISQGMDALTPEEQMAIILNKTRNWVCFTTAWEVDSDEALLWDAWSQYGYLYLPWTTSPVAISPDSQVDVASVIKNTTNGGAYTAVAYGPIDISAFIMGIVASIAWMREQGTITLAFKRQSGLAPWVVDEQAATILEAKGYNYIGNFAARNTEFVFLFPGQMLNSDYGFIDSYVNSIWFNERLQVSLMDGITSVGRAPYNARGYNMIAAWMADPINEARTNGAIEPGIQLSERQKTEVSNEAGLNISDELWTQGYYVQVLDPGAPVRARRESPIVNIWYTYGGAIHKIDVASTAIL